MEMLTKNGILDISRDRQVSNPVFQIIHIQPMKDKDRHILVLSDSEYHMEALCTNNLTLDIKSNRIKNFAIVKFLEYNVNKAKNGKKVILALKGEILNKSYGSEIGNSVTYTEATIQPPQQPKNARFQQHQQENTAKKPKTANNGNDYQKMTKTNYGDKSVPEVSDYEQYVMPLEALNPYRHKWAIKVRCTGKSDIRTWSKPSSTGKLFSVDLLDDSGTEIRATMFNEAADRFNDVFSEGNVYIIAKARVKLANKKFTSIRNDYELTINIDSHVEMVRDDRRISKMNYQFCKIKDLENADENSSADILAVISSIGEIASIHSAKQNKYIDKRTIILSDQTASIELTVWGETANSYNEELCGNCPILAIKSGRVSNFGGKSISASMNSKLTLNPDLPEVYTLKSWWQNGGENANPASITLSSSSRFGTISETDKRLDTSEAKNCLVGKNTAEKGEVFVVEGTILNIRHAFEKPPYYFACSKLREGRSCNKKASKVTNGTEEEFWCETCNSATEAKARYILSFMLCDHEGSFYASCFDEIGEKILGVSAVELSKRCEGTLANEAEFSETFLNSTLQTKLFKIQAKEETYMDEEKIRYNVLCIADIDYVKESVMLLEKINSLQ